MAVHTDMEEVQHLVLLLRPKFPAITTPRSHQEIIGHRGEIGHQEATGRHEDIGTN